MQKNRVYQVPGFIINNKIYESPRSAIFNGINQKEHNLPVVIKFYKSELLTQNEIDKIENEYTLLKNLHIPGIITLYSIENYNNGKVFIFENFGAISLAAYLKKQIPDIKNFLEIALKIIDIIAEIHKSSIIHKNITPYNILINEENMEIKLIDFEIACRLKREMRSAMKAEKLEGSLSYISPEQTGRMNRTIDYRTDFYSYGITLYEMITGKLPFESKDALELVHMHIAKLPAEPHKVNSNVPEILSAIIMKLLAKNAEDRYQSENGIKHDLMTCLKMLDSKKPIKFFHLGKMDIAETFYIPEKQYGREQEKKIIMKNLVSAYSSRSKPKIIFISGIPGIGKSSLINDIHKMLVEKKCYFIQGKYDQFKKSMPFSAIIAAFSDLINQLLAEKENILSKWQEKIRKAIGNGGNALIEVIPQLKMIIGEQPVLPQLSPQESENRFGYIFQNFISVFTGEEHPLCIFLDDLQWADKASIHILKIIFNDSQLRNFIFIGSFRDNEITENHPLNSFFEYSKTEKIEFINLKLKPLMIEEINELLSDTLHCDRAKVNELAEIIKIKTGGNPFFIIEFLKSLYDRKLIFFNNGWNWDENKINQTQITDNVVEFMTDKISRLPPKTQKLMKIASCEGISFNLDVVSMISGLKKEETFGDLTQVINDGMLIKLETEFRFTHDRIREAVYGLLKNKQRIRYHYLVGNILLNNTSKEELNENIFNIVQQLNYTVEIITNKDEKINLAKLNLSAGAKAKSATAYDLSTTYLETGRNLLPEDSWDKLYDLSFSLYTEGGEAEYLIGNQQKAEGLFAEALRNAKDNLDKIKIFDIQIPLYVVNNKMSAAFAQGRKALALLGLNMPKKANPLNILINLIKVKRILKYNKIESLINLPVMSDPKKLAVCNMLIQMTLPVYISFPDYLPIIIFKTLNFSLKNGNSIYSLYSYVAYGLILCCYLNQIEDGYKFGSMAYRMLGNFESNFLKCKIIFIFSNTIRHWKKSLHEDISLLEEGYKAGFESGDLSFASYCINHSLAHSIFCGETLVSTKEKANRYYEIIRKFKQRDALYAFLLFSQLIKNLSGITPSKYAFKGELFNEDKIIPEWNNTKNYTDLAFYTVCKEFIHYLYGDYKTCLEYAEQGKKYMGAILGMLYVKEHYYYYSLALLGEFNNVSKSKQKVYLKIIHNNIKKIKNWADHCPENCLHKLLFVQAELKAKLGFIQQAMEFYDKAAGEAGENGFIHEQGMILEHAGIFYKALGREKIARLYFNDAYLAFKKWGANMKLHELKSRYTINEKVRDYSPLETGYAASDLDLNSIMKSATAISGEIIMERLIGKLIKIVMENAGAERAVLILNKDNRYVIEAMGRIGNAEVKKLNSVLLDNSNLVPETIIHYAARTNKSVVLNNAYMEGSFTNDDFIRNNRIKSVLCVPIINKGNIIAIIYLENNLTAGVFTEERLQVINMLLGQIGISIDNASLYEKLEDYSKNLEIKVKERTIELEDANIKLKELDELKNDFIANITHDFRSPLTAILNVADLELKLKKYDPDALKTIYNAAVRLRHSIDRLLEIAKMDVLGIKLNVRKANPALLLQKIIAFYSSSVIGSGIRIIQKFKKTDIKDFYTDTEKLEEIIDNILSNSIKYVNPQHGVIALDLVEKQDSIVISIEDNGIGIPKSKLETIFNRFEQAHEEQNVKYHGTGIGLAFARQLAGFLKGIIWAESGGEEKGARFFIEMKKGPDVFDEKDFYISTDSREAGKKYRHNDIKKIIQAEIEKNQEKKEIVKIFNELNESGEFEYKKGIILIADDDKIIREIVMGYLMNDGYRNFILAPSGKLALEAVYEYPPDLIICDYNMPNMRGDKFHNELIDNPKFKEIPFIFLSAVANRNIIIERKQKGASAYLKKPIDEKDLLLAVDFHIKKYFEYLKLAQLATIDALTGLNNKRAVITHLKRELAIRKYRDLVLIFFDLDNFKEINDRFGHQVGDKILSTIGKMVKVSIRNYDIVGRFGGDGFIVILPETNLEQAKIVIAGLQKAIMKTTLTDNKKKALMSASFGVSSLKDNAAYIEEILHIDNLKQLYEIKKNHKADWNQIEKTKERIAEVLLRIADISLYKAKQTLCSSCGFSSEKTYVFNKNRCPKCGSNDLQKGRNKIVFLNRPDSHPT